MIAPPGRAGGALLNRFPLMFRCEDEGCAKLNVIPPGMDITMLQAKRFFCWMNPDPVGTTAIACCHVPVEGEAWVPKPKAVKGKRKSAAKGWKNHQKATSLGSGSAAARHVRPVGGARKRPAMGPGSSASASSSSLSSPRTSSSESESRATSPALPEIPSEPYDVGTTIMVLYGKTTYPGQVIDRNLELKSYLIRYDGLAANRAEWRGHSELVSIHEVSQVRRRASRRSTVNYT